LPTRTSRESSDAVVWQSLSDMSTHKLGWNLEAWRRGCLRKHLERILSYSGWARSMNAQPPRNCARTMSRLATSGADWNRKKIWTRSVLEMQFLVLGEAASTAYGGAGGILPATGWHEGERGGSAYKKRTGMPCARSTEPVLGGPQNLLRVPAWSAASSRRPEREREQRLIFEPITLLGLLIVTGLQLCEQRFPFSGPTSRL
jgi:hypothetical protein